MPPCIVSLELGLLTVKRCNFVSQLCFVFALAGHSQGIRFLCTRRARKHINMNAKVREIA